MLNANRTFFIGETYDDGSVNYSFAEVGDLVYYRQPGTNERKLATINWIHRNERGKPNAFSITLKDGTEIEEAPINTITY